VTRAVTLAVTLAVKGRPDIRDRGASTPAAAPPSDPNARSGDLAHATPNPILVDLSAEALMAAESYWGGGSVFTREAR